MGSLYLFGGRYSPTILLLRHFDVFRNFASHEGLPSNQIGLSSEFASVIRKFTEPVASDEDGNEEDMSDGEFVRPNLLAVSFS